jgi:hypothetical protein
MDLSEAIVQKGHLQLRMLKTNLYPAICGCDLQELPWWPDPASWALISIPEIKPIAVQAEEDSLNGNI